jgi:hypothetical protein
VGNDDREDRRARASSGSANQQAPSSARQRPASGARSPRAPSDRLDYRCAGIPQNTHHSQEAQFRRRRFGGLGMHSRAARGKRYEGAVPRRRSILSYSIPRSRTRRNNSRHGAVRALRIGNRTGQMPTRPVPITVPDTPDVVRSARARRMTPAERRTSAGLDAMPPSFTLDHEFLPAPIKPQIAHELLHEALRALQGGHHSYVVRGSLDHEQLVRAQQLRDSEGNPRVFSGSGLALQVARRLHVRRAKRGTHGTAGNCIAQAAIVDSVEESFRSRVLKCPGPPLNQRHADFQSLRLVATQWTQVTRTQR